MVSGFWKKLKKPIYALAPLSNVTDAAFRRVIAKYGKPDVMFTEFVSCDGLCSRGRKSLLSDLMYTESERPIVMQIFGATPENFYRCALYARELRFDGIDINMGCPDKTIEKQGAGAVLIKNPELAKKIIKETKRGAGKLPVSIKTRIGYATNTIDTWIRHLLESEVAVITIHGRTRKEMSAVPAHWDAIHRAVEIVHSYDSSPTRTRILGNGDVSSAAEAQQKVELYGVDGVMIGRGIFGNPWLFNKRKNSSSITIKEKLFVMVEHTEIFEELFLGIKSLDVMKKHYKAYVSGFDGAKALRMRLMESKNAREVAGRVAQFLDQDGASDILSAV